MDEAGRGPLAGPIVAASVMLRIPFTEFQNHCGCTIRDSKLLSHSKRELIYTALTDRYACVVTEVIGAEDINVHGIGWANKELFIRLIKKTQASLYIIDGNLKISVPGKNTKSIIDADATIPEVMLAGTIAKVTRDRMMSEFANEYPEYGWQHNAGYGTKSHIEAIKKYGVTAQHRTQFVTSALSHSK
jgi:ribonuclease HII